MDLPDEREKDFSEIQPKTKHITISRKDTMLNDLKNSTVEGILSFIFSLISIGVTALGIYSGYVSSGKAGYAVGIFPIIALLMAAESIVLGIFGLKNRKKIRHYMERRGIILSSILILLLIALYIWGLKIYLGR